VLSLWCACELGCASCLDFFCTCALGSAATAVLALGTTPSEKARFRRSGSF
jgi:hypothetical protein